jgi:hypothetical protein
MNEACSGFDPIDDLVETFLERYRRGERPHLAEYTEKYPELTERIRGLFPALLAIEELGAADGSEIARPEDQNTAAAMLPVMLGDYRVLRPVGSGGMGIVYEAIQESLGRYVALKPLASHQLNDPTRLERFRREARAAARLHHTHIVPVYGIGEHDGIHFYTMQFIRGQAWTPFSTRSSGCDAMVNQPAWTIRTTAPSVRSPWQAGCAPAGSRPARRTQDGRDRGLPLCGRRMTRVLQHRPSDLWPATNLLIDPACPTSPNPGIS